MRRLLVPLVSLAVAAIPWLHRPIEVVHKVQTVLTVTPAWAMDDGPTIAPPDGQTAVGTLPPVDPIVDANPAPLPAGVPTEAHWRAISQCESGGENGWRTGYFGIEAGYPIGDLSWDEQVAWADRIWLSFGASAWGCRTDVP